MQAPEGVAWLRGFLLALPFKEMPFRGSNDTLVLSSQTVIQSLQGLVLPQEVDECLLQFISSNLFLVSMLLLLPQNGDCHGIPVFS